MSRLRRPFCFLVEDQTEMEQDEQAIAVMSSPIVGVIADGSSSAHCTWTCGFGWCVSERRWSKSNRQEWLRPRFGVGMLSEPCIPG